jgi:hypothetical protein
MLPTLGYQNALYAIPTSRWALASTVAGVATCLMFLADLALIKWSVAPSYRYVIAFGSSGPAGAHYEFVHQCALSLMLVMLLLAIAGVGAGSVAMFKKRSIPLALAGVALSFAPLVFLVLVK